MVLLKENSIFVSIASYRDDVCTDTLDSLFKMAENPNRIFVGICQQNNSTEDTDCLSAIINTPLENNVRIIRIPHYEAKGPTYARYLCSTLWNGEQYFLQIDSHTKFVKGWDTICINMIQSIKKNKLSLKPVISYYPRESKNYEKYTEEHKYNVPRMCKSFFNERGMISFLASREINTNNKVYQTPHLAGGMFFCESNFLNELPFDPDLPYLFVGEEILHSIRFFTNGWDIFTPSENIIFHEYTRKDKPKIWTDNPYYSDMTAFNKVKHYLGLDKNDGSQGIQTNKYINLDTSLAIYGLGKVRTIQEFYDFAGIDIAGKRVVKNFCNTDNIASNEDIIGSNKIKETQTPSDFKYLSYIYYLLSFCILILILIILKVFRVFKR
jgi:[Skp1-protein]-hydroxyproline N-acetylglucosaminyltransferase